jgi:hypothetical protein
MGRYLVVAPAGNGDESLFEELGRLATREPSRFHVVVPRPPEATSYDAVVIPVPAVRLIDTIDIEGARRLHQIDVPVIQFVPPAGTTRS